MACKQLRRPESFKGNFCTYCEHCWAYFCTYCDLENWAWTCALYGNYNGLPSDSIKRFSSDCPELSSSFIDLELEPTGDDESGDIELKAQPVYVAVVDLCSSEEFIELIKSALLAVLEDHSGIIGGRGEGREKPTD